MTRPLHRPLGWALDQRWRGGTRAALVREWAVARYAYAPLPLHMGAGPNRLDGCLNTHAHPSTPLYLDITRPLPFPSANVDAAYREQVNGHLTLEDAAVFLADAFRLLPPGSAIRLSTPGLERKAATYAEDAPEMTTLGALLAGQGGCVFGTCGEAVLDTLFHGWGHRYLNGFASLSALLVTVRFDALSRHPLQQSEKEEIRGIEQHDQSTVLDAFTLVMEGEKPSLGGTA